MAGVPSRLICFAARKFGLPVCRVYSHLATPDPSEFLLAVPKSFTTKIRLSRKKWIVATDFSMASQSQMLSPGVTFFRENHITQRFTCEQCLLRLGRQGSLMAMLWHTNTEIGNSGAGARAPMTNLPFSYHVVLHVGMW